MAILGLLRRASAVVGQTASPLLGLESARHRYLQAGRAHVAVRGLHDPANAAAATALRTRLIELSGVTEVAVNAALGRVVVWYDETTRPVDDLVAEIAAFEREQGLDGASYAPVAAPDDHSTVVRQAALLGAAVAGSTLTLIGSVGRIPRLTPTVPAVLALLDNTPPLRHRLESRFGADLTDAALGYGGAVAQTLAQRPLALLVDAAHRANLLGAAVAQRRAWQRREAVLATVPGAFVSPAVSVPDRPVPLADGPAGRAAAAAASAAVLASAVTLLGTRRADRAGAVLGAGVMRGAELAGEAFHAQLSRACAAREIVVIDPHAIRRMDRVDTVVLDASAVLTGNTVIEDVVPVDGHSDGDELSLRAQALVELDDVTARRHRDGWSVRPLGRPTGLAEAARATAQGWSSAGATVLRLEREGRTVGLVNVAPELDPLAGSLVRRAKATGAVLVAGLGSRLDRRLDVDGVVASGPHLLASVRDLQRDGHGVALVSARGGAALAAADLGVAVVSDAGNVPWGAHVLCAGGLADLHLLVDALPVARRALARGVGLSVAASVAAAALGLLGSPAAAARRSQLPVVAAGAAGLVTGTWYAVTVAARPPPTAADRTPWHAMPTDAVLRLLGSTPDGLAEDAAARRRGISETNGVAGDSVVHESVEELANPVTAALALSAGMSALLGSVLDAGLIAAVLGLNLLIGLAERSGAGRALQTLAAASSVPVRLRRNGSQQAVTAESLVPGDVVELRAGDAVPADCRLLEAKNLEVDESGLTGESQPTGKTAQPTPARAVPDRHSMLYEGTAVAVGSARAVVTATGERTELRRTLRTAGHARRPAGVEARLRTLMRLSVPISIGAGVALLGSTLLRGGTFTQAIGPATNLAVAAVPEGLPFVATVAELAAARRLTARGALVRRPATLEALGRVDMLCFDKTGTLTEGRIRLRYVSDGRRTAALPGLSGDLRTVLAAALRASPTPDGEPMPHATDRAVVAGAREAGVDASHGMGAWRPLRELPFEPSLGYHAVLGEHPGGRMLTVKGAPELVLDRCSHWRSDGDVLPLDGAARRRLDAEIARLARRGYRVLAVAERPASAQPDLTAARVGQLRLIGLLGLADAVRPTAKEAVRSLREAGVRVVMVTGDHPGTAAAIAEELDALNGRRVVTGPDLDELDDAGLAGVLDEVAVFARVTPAQKARIVEVLSTSGRTVAVTGDGANTHPPSGWPMSGWRWAPTPPRPRARPPTSSLPTTGSRRSSTRCWRAARCGPRFATRSPSCWAATSGRCCSPQPPVWSPGGAR